MKTLARYVSDYLRGIKLWPTSAIVLILIGLTAFNYISGLNQKLLNSPSFAYRFGGFFLLFFSVFSLAWLPNLPRQPRFYLLLFLAPALFALKVSVRAADLFPGLNDYFIVALQWPLKALTVILGLLVISKIEKTPTPVFGLGLANARLQPYFALLLFMIPLIVLAGTRPDFQAVYPKFQLVDISALNGWRYWLAAAGFELAYGIDFFTIELFFRGFLVLAFIKYAGRDAILPMAVFYCTIHFGKPLGECISSFFGGIILGAIVYRTRSIWGGLIVHLGIAWMMELVGVVL